MSTEYRKPGVYVEETLLTGSNDGGTAATTFLLVGATNKGRSIDPIRIESMTDFENEFGSLKSNEKIALEVATGPDTTTTVDVRNYLGQAVSSFFQNGGRTLYVQRATAAGTDTDFAQLDVVGGGDNTVFTAAGAPDSTTAAGAIDGDFYVDTTAKELYGPLSGGDWGTANAYLGAGNETASVFTGTATPPSGTGTDGDFYVRTTATGWDIYGPKDTTASPQWGTATVLVDTSGLGGSESTAFTIRAISAGTWGNNIEVITTSDGDGTYTLRVFMNSGDGSYLVETFSGLSLTDDQFGTKRIDEAINDPVYGSSYIRVGHYVDSVWQNGLPVISVLPGTGNADYTNLPKTALAGGVDPAAPSVTELSEAMESALGKIEGAVIAASAGYMDPVNGYIAADIAYLSAGDILDRGDIMLIDDNTNPREPGSPSADYATALVSGDNLGVRHLGNSYVAAYAPWIVTTNRARRGSTLTVPPAGSVMGVIARNDATSGIFRAPAGIDAVIVNAVGVDTKFTDGDLGLLNVRGVNIIRPVTGRGICVMGARTRKRNAVDKYISARRTLIYLRDALRASTEFALFENNDERLWDRMSTTAERLLRPVWLGGGLRGTSPGEAYYIICDETINTPAVIASGEVRMEVGVALEYPAEYVVIRLTQYEQGGVNVEVNPS